MWMWQFETGSRVIIISHQSDYFTFVVEITTGRSLTPSNFVSARAHCCRTVRIAACLLNASRYDRLLCSGSMAKRHSKVWITSSHQPLSSCLSRIPATRWA